MKKLSVTKLCVAKLFVTKSFLCERIWCDKDVCERLWGKVMRLTLWVAKLRGREMYACVCVYVKNLCAKELCVTKLPAIKLHEFARERDM